MQMGKLTFGMKAAEAVLRDADDAASLLQTLAIVFIVSVFAFSAVWAIATALA
jgi:hypothetical protein